MSVVPVFVGGLHRHPPPREQDFVAINKRWDTGESVSIWVKTRAGFPLSRE
ncbi:MAG: hypothetical protein IPH59_08505 [bacterium]|nr:hypothetical protein [bacterium]